MPFYPEAIIIPESGKNRDNIFYVKLTDRHILKFSLLRPFFNLFAQIVSHYQFDEIFPDIVNLSKVDNLINV